MSARLIFASLAAILLLLLSHWLFDGLGVYLLFPGYMLAFRLVPGGVYGGEWVEVTMNGINFGLYTLVFYLAQLFWSRRGGSSHRARRNLSR